MFNAEEDRAALHKHLASALVRPAIREKDDLRCLTVGQLLAA